MFRNSFAALRSLCFRLGFATIAASWSALWASVRKSSGLGGAWSPVEHLRDMAAECRQVAAACHDAGVRRELMLVAERFERLAELRKQGKTSPTAPTQSKTDA